MDSAKLRRFGKIVRSRRLALGLTQSQVTEKGGPSDKRQTQIENGTPPAPSLTTLAKVDMGLRWKPGSAAAALNGGTPTPVEAAVYTAEDLDRHARLTVALERAGVRAVGARGAHRVEGGTVFSADAIEELIAVLDALPATD